MMGVFVRFDVIAIDKVMLGADYGIVLLTGNDSSSWWVYEEQIGMSSYPF